MTTPPRAKKIMHWSIRVALVLLVMGVLAYAGFAGWLRYGGERDFRFATSTELLSYEKDHHWSLWRGTFYQGDRDGRSWFVNDQDVRGHFVLSIPSEAWHPPQRLAYTPARSFWIGWYEGPGKALGDLSDF